MSLMVWVDCETTGLEIEKDFLLEIAVAITNKQGKWINGNSWLLSPYTPNKHKAVRRAKKDPIVGPMHEASKLWEDLMHAPRYDERDIENFILQYLVQFDFNEKVPVCGSSVHFDRKFIGKFMPELDNWFSHRIIDNSSTKELCKLHNPEVYARLNKETHPRKIHRGIPDLHDTIEEYQFYLNNFLVV